MRLSDGWAWGSVVDIMDKADCRVVEVWADGLVGWIVLCRFRMGYSPPQPWARLIRACVPRLVGKISSRWD